MSTEVPPPVTPAVPQGGSTREQVVAKAKARARQTGGQGLAKAKEQLQQRSFQAGEQVESAAQDVRSVGGELLKTGKDTPARLLVQAADQTERISRYMKSLDAAKIDSYQHQVTSGVKSLDPSRTLTKVEDFGRRRTWPVIGVGVSLGYVASRLIKSSSAKRYEGGSETPVPSAGDGVVPVTNGAPADAAPPVGPAPVEAAPSAPVVTPSAPVRTPASGRSARPGADPVSSPPSTPRPDVRRPS